MLETLTIIDKMLESLIIDKMLESLTMDKMLESFIKRQLIVEDSAADMLNGWAEDNKDVCVGEGGGRRVGQSDPKELMIHPCQGSTHLFEFENMKHMNSSRVHNGVVRGKGGGGDVELHVLGCQFTY